MEDDSRLDSLKAKLGDQLLIDELSEQLNRTRGLLRRSPDEVAEQALAAGGRDAAVELRITVALSAQSTLAAPDRFPEAHRLAMRALEVLDREGSRDAGAPGLGPLKPLAEPAVEFVADYIVTSYAKNVVNRLRTLYARREAQATPGTPERRDLARARLDLDRIAPGFSGGSPLTPVLAAGASVSALASVFQFLGAVDFGNRRLLATTAAVLFVVFFLLAGILLRGAAVARRRSALTMQGPLAALWETIGNAGDPPRDDSEDFARISIGLTALVWVVGPAVLALFLLL
ncbi:MAG: hypothetical protein IT302_12315 [Dehalococcoidia bacterium]|nr:hypothetical protein [Dehalococcoidia bacterium]